MSRRNTINLVATLSYLLVNIVIGVLLTPVLIRYLGVENFGYVSLSTSIVSYLSLLTFSIQGSLGRFLSIALTNGEIDQARAYYNSGFWGLVSISLLVALGVILSLSVFLALGGASSKSLDLSSLLALVVAAFVITTIASAFLLSAFVHNRLEVKSLCESAGLVVRGAVTLILVVLVSPSLSSVGWGFVAGALVLLLASARVRRKMTPELVLSLTWVSREKLKELSALSCWLLVNQVGALLFLQVEVVMAGFLLGARQAGIYAALLVFVTLLRSLARAIASSLVPTFLHHVAKDDRAALVKLALRAEVAMGLAVALPVGLIVPLGDAILSHWLGPGFVPWSSLLAIMVVHLVLNLAVLPLFNINVALNKIKSPAQVTLSLGLVNVALMMVLGNEKALGLYGIAAASAITLTLKNLLYTPWYAAKVLGASSWRFYAGILPGVASSCVIALAGLAARAMLDLNYLQSFLLSLLVISLLYIAVTFMVFSNRLREAE